jgi:dihydrodipicolinate synthase/N-acetylneuraminate lyase
VSGLAAAFPDVVAEVVRSPDAVGGARLEQLRGAVERHPFQSALKHVLRARGVPMSGDARAPLPSLTADEADEVERLALAGVA